MKTFMQWLSEHMGIEFGVTGHGSKGISEKPLKVAKFKKKKSKFKMPKLVGEPNGIAGTKLDPGG